MTDDPTPRVGVRTRTLSEARLRYVKQLGADDVFVDPLTEDDVNDPHLGRAAAGPEGLLFRRDRAPTAEELRTVRERVESADLRLAGIQTVPAPFYEAIALGTDGATDRLEWYRDLVRAAGRADVPVVGYQWCPGGVYRTGDRPVRGGATATAYDHAEFDAPASADEGPTEEAMWDHYERFLEAVLPVAEEAGVRLALHPDDPPTVERLDGLPRLFRDAAAFERAMELVPSDAHGLKLCLGCFSEMPDVDVAEVVRRFGGRDEIVFVHFRDVEGTMPAFVETFADAGNFDAAAVMRELAAVGFSGAVIPDHVPGVEGDTDWGHRARGYTVGYLAGLRDAVGSDG